MSTDCRKALVSRCRFSVLMLGMSVAWAGDVPAPHLESARPGQQYVVLDNAQPGSYVVLVNGVAQPPANCPAMPCQLALPEPLNRGDDVEVFPAQDTVEQAGRDRLILQFESHAITGAEPGKHSIAVQLSSPAADPVKEIDVLVQRGGVRLEFLTIPARDGVATAELRNSLEPGDIVSVSPSGNALADYFYVKQNGTSVTVRSGPVPALPLISPPKIGDAQVKALAPSGSLTGRKYELTLVPDRHSDRTFSVSSPVSAGPDSQHDQVVFDLGAARIGGGDRLTLSDSTGDGLQPPQPEQFTVASESAPALPTIVQPIMAGTTEVDAIVPADQANRQYQLQICKGRRVLPFTITGTVSPIDSDSQHKQIRFVMSAPLSVGETVELSDATNDGLTAPTPSQATVMSFTPPDGEQTRFIVGLQQAGASGADSDQRFFLDTYVSRPIPLFGPHADADETGKPYPFRWWGNVRIASVAKPLGTQADNFIVGLAGEAGALKPSELADSAEFLTGLDFSIWQSNTDLRLGESSDSHQAFRLALFAAAGASGLLNVSNLDQTFLLPQRGTQAFSVLSTQAKIPDNCVTTPGSPATPPSAAVPPSACFVRFHTPVVRYPRQLWAGFRLTSFSFSAAGRPDYAPPALVSIGFGLNEAVTHAMSTMRLDGFYPLKLNGKYGPIYLFGTAQIGFDRHRAAPAFLGLDSTENAPLASANQRFTPNSNNTITIPGTTKSHDLYSIGIGLDLVQAVHLLSQSGKAQPQVASQGAPPAPPNEGVGARK